MENLIKTLFLASLIDGTWQYAGALDQNRVKTFNLALELS